MKNAFKSIPKTTILIFALLSIVVSNSCKIDTSNQFKDTQKLEKLLSDFEKELESENHQMRIGIENKDGEKSTVLRFTFENVKMNLMDSTLVDRSKQLMKGVYDEVKDKDQFDKYVVLYNKDPNFKEETNGKNFSFSVNTINHSFSKEDLK